MNGRKARILIIASILLIFSLILIVIGKYNKKDVILTEKNNKNKAISIMIETGLGTGVYELSEDDEWPGEGYGLNTTRSGCENGSTLSYDTDTNKVVIRGKISDKCYIFFDIIPPDIAVNVSSLPTTYGKTANITATGVTAVYNNKLNQIELSNATTDKMNVSLSFSNATGTTALNNYIIGLAGTTQGDGQLVHEIGETYDYTSVNVIKTFGTTPVYFRNTSSTSTDQTQVDSYWSFNNSTGVFTSDPTKFTASGTDNYYHAYMQVPSNGYYQVCYTIAQSPHSSNHLSFTRHFTGGYSSSNASTSTSAAVEGCYDFGYVQTTDYINISERGYSGTSSPVMTFRIEKSNNVIELDTGYRFEGNNPNNYVMFNNELWRIIGVFSTEYDSNNDGTEESTANLVKIIRGDSLGSLVWNKTNTNDWPNSSLYHLLNEQYYDWETNKVSVSTYCYQKSSNIAGKCDYSIKGIQDGYRGMIVKAKWYLGGGGKTGYTNYTPGNIYSYERDSNAVYTGRSASILGYIGLMYESDFLFAVLPSNCKRSTLHSSYANAKCTGKDWLRGNGYEWTISPNSNNSNAVWNLTSNGSMGNKDTTSGYAVRPVLYLSSFVYKVSGTGTITDPYIIGM